MMRTDTDETVATPFWPPAMERGRVADAAFARAYARTPDRHRALIKTGIAAVYAACGGPMPARRRRDEDLGHDLRLVREDGPLDFAVIVCGREFASPARLAAAVLPALCARVGEVAAVRVGAAWPEPLLVALELCGLETACRLGRRAMAGLWADLAALGRGAVVLLDGADRPAGEPGANLDVYCAKTAGRALVCDGPGAACDREALAVAQPDLALDEAASLPDGPESLDKAAVSGYDALYVGDGGLDAALETAGLVLGPGRESFWLWPRLLPEAFRRPRLAASIADGMA